MAAGERSRAAPISACEPPVFPHPFSQRVSPLLDTTHPRKIYTALVRRHSYRLDHLHALLSGASPCWVRLRSHRRNALSRLDASAGPRHNSVALDRPASLSRENLDFPDYPHCKLEAVARHRSRTSHPLGSSNRRRPAVLHFVYHRAPPAGVVSAYSAKGIALPSLCRFESWFVPCAICFSDRSGTSPDAENAGLSLDGRLLSIRPELSCLRIFCRACRTPGGYST